MSSGAMASGDLGNQMVKWGWKGKRKRKGRKRNPLGRENGEEESKRGKREDGKA